MLRLFLKLYFKSKLKKIPSYICILLILAFLTERYIHPSTYIFFITSYFFFLFLYLEVKEKKICIISDTKLNQKNYYDETGLEAFRKKKLKKKYRKWLILTITEKNHDIVETQFFTGNSGYYCLCCYFSIIPIIIIYIIASIYLTLSQSIVIILGVVISMIILYIMLGRRATNIRCKQLDSEIKQILFEEETGYSPLVKGRYTYKYRAWLKTSEEKMRTVPYRN